MEENPAASCPLPTFEEEELSRTMGVIPTFKEQDLTGVLGPSATFEQPTDTLGQIPSPWEEEPEEGPTSTVSHFLAFKRDIYVVSRVVLIMSMLLS